MALAFPYITLDYPPLSGEDIYIYVKSEGGVAPDDGTGGTRSLIVGEPTEEVRHCRWCGLFVCSSVVEKDGAKRQPGR